MNSDKNYLLETFRGLAALVVFFSHFSLAFLSTKLNSTIDSNNLTGTPMFIFLNGYGAMIFFFVLSGYVLTCKYFENQNIEDFSKRATKRYLRFVFPVTLIFLFSHLIDSYKLYYYSQASSLNSSYWLSRIDGFRLTTNIALTTTEALKLGSYKAFYYGHAVLNPNLWSMRFSIMGSCVAFGLAPLLSKTKNSFSTSILLISASIMATSISIYYLCFIAGVFMAFAGNKSLFPKMDLRGKFFLAMLTIWIFSLNGFNGAFSFFNFLSPWKDETKVIFFTFGSCLLLLLLLSVERLSSLFLVRIGKFLGKISFSIYLLHVPIIATFSSWFYYYYYHKLGENVLVTLLFFLTLLLLFMSAWLFSIIDAKWVRLVNRLFE